MTARPFRFGHGVLRTDLLPADAAPAVATGPIAPESFSGPATLQRIKSQPQHGPVIAPAQPASAAAGTTSDQFLNAEFLEPIVPEVDALPSGSHKEDIR